MDDFTRKIDEPFAVLRRRGFKFISSSGRVFSFADSSGKIHEVPVTVTYGIFSKNLTEYIKSI